MIIETTRLLLRPMEAGDCLDLLMTFGDPKVMAAFGVEPFREPEMKRWVARNLEPVSYTHLTLPTILLV